MPFALIQHIIAFFYLLTGSISDLRKREVADWSNYGLIAMGIFFHAVLSVWLLDVQYIARSLIGLGVFWIIALAFYYSGQWGGGDAKMLMGIGALYGLGWEYSHNRFLFGFFFNMLIAGAAYGICFSVYLAFRNRSAFQKEYRRLSMIPLFHWMKIILLAGLFAAVVLSFFGLDLILLGIPAFFAFLLYLGLFIKSVEKSTMYRNLPVSKLTEGDWVAKEIHHNGKYICGPKDLGLSKKQIAKLKRLKRKTILVKEGIPFVPSFFLGWILNLFFGNLLLNIFA